MTPAPNSPTVEAGDGVTKHVVTEGYLDGLLIIHRVISETEKQLKTHEGSPYSGRFEDRRLFTLARTKVLADFPDEDSARAAMARAKAAWDRAAGPVGDAKRILAERQQRQRSEWLSALDPTGSAGGAKA